MRYGTTLGIVLTISLGAIDHGSVAVTRVRLKNTRGCFLWCREFGIVESHFTLDRSEVGRGVCSWVYFYSVFLLVLFILN